MNYGSPRIENIFSFLPVERKYFPAVPIGSTPLWKVQNPHSKTSSVELYVKNDTLNLTGSTKDRASYLVTALATKFNYPAICVASTGNAASSQAGLCACAGLSSIVFIPEKTPQAKVLQCQHYGAKIFKVAGGYDQAYQMSLEYTREHDQKILSRNTAYNPLTIEGKKTVSLEIFREMGKVPDYIFIPAGDGVILSGVYKGFRDLVDYGFSNHVPKIIAVQSSQSCALYHGLYQGKFDQNYQAQTIADSLSVNIPQAGYLATSYLSKYQGEIMLVSDQEILDAQRELSLNTGVFAEPSAAAGYAGFKKYQNFKLNSSVVLLITGSGFKDMDRAASLSFNPVPLISSVGEIDLFTTREKQR
ncbi:MAG: threonine synthase [bacterium]